MQDEKKPAVHPETVKDEAQLQEELDRKARALLEEKEACVCHSGSDHHPAVVRFFHRGA